jgi:hypothetical protein
LTWTAAARKMLLKKRVQETRRESDSRPSTRRSLCVLFHGVSRVLIDTYTPPEAVRIFRLRRRRVTQMLNAGELEGVQDPETDRWYIPQRAVHERLKDPPPARGRPNKGQERTAESGEEAAELRDRVEKRRDLTDPSSPVLGPLSAAEPVITA